MCILTLFSYYSKKMQCNKEKSDMFSCFADKIKKNEVHNCNYMYYVYLFVSLSVCTDSCSPYAEISVTAAVPFVMIGVFLTFEQSSMYVRLHEDMQSDIHRKDCRSLKRHQTYGTAAATKFTRIGSRLSGVHWQTAKKSTWYI